VLTTTSVVGYASCVITPLGKIIIIFYLVVVVSVFPGLASRLVELINSKSIYARAKYKTLNNVGHIIIIGNVS